MCQRVPSSLREKSKSIHPQFSGLISHYSYTLRPPHLTQDHTDPFLFFSPSQMLLPDLSFCYALLQVFFFPGYLQILLLHCCYQFPTAVVTNDHKHENTTHIYYLTVLKTRSPRIKVSAGLYPFQRLQGNICFHAFFSSYRLFAFFSS